MKEIEKKTVLKLNDKKYQVIILKDITKEIKEFLYSFADVYYDTNDTYYIINKFAFLFYEDLMESCNKTKDLHWTKSTENPYIVNNPKKIKMKKINWNRIGKMSMEETKYYTPSIEEFRVGFRYELLKNDKWITEVVSKDTITLGDYDRTTDLYPILYNHIKVRVKYLDRSDIEELGWKYFETEGTVITYILNDYNLVLYNTGNIKIEDQNCIDINTDSTLFNGVIKNYNELKSLMQILEIC